MATTAFTSKYYVLTPGGDNLDFLDFNLSYGNGSITDRGEVVQYNGSARIDSVFVRPGLTYDLTNTGPLTDKIYLTGNLSDYAMSAVGGVLTLSRTVNTLIANNQYEEVRVANGTSFNFDNLVFANGTVSANTLYNDVFNSLPLPIPDPIETSLNPQNAAHPGAPLSASIKAYSTNTAGIGQVGETFASVKAGMSLTINGGNGIDSAYVADGEILDATVTGGSVDLIYMRGTWADYTKQMLAGTNNLQLTRVINGSVETVTVNAGTAFNYDRLIFADGAITTIAAKQTTDPGFVGPVVLDPGTKTPLYSDEEVQNAINAIRDAAQLNNADSGTPTALTYHIAGINGVDASNLASMNSALDTLPVTGGSVDTAPKIQTLVDAYKAILAEANGAAANPNPLLTSTPYTTIGVTNVSGTPAPGNALYFLDDVVDNSNTAAVDTVPEIQAMADAAARVMAAAGGTAAQAAALTQTDLTNLGITGVNPGNIAAIEAAIQASSDSAVDTQAEIQALVNIAAINHAPVLDASKSPTLGSIDTTGALSAPAGAVGTLVSALVNTTGIANFSDADAGTSAGMAITGYNSGAGTLYYSTNNGTTWTTWTPSGNLGLHLLADSSTRIFFKPVGNALGDAAISFEAWDHSNGVANGAIAAITAVGGSTAYSSISDSIGYSLLGGAYSPAASTINPVSHEVMSSMIGNFNGDGFMDLATGGYDNAELFVRLGTAGGVTSTPNDNGIITTATGQRINGSDRFASVLDFNGDGYADVSDAAAGIYSVAFGNSAGHINTNAVTASWTGHLTNYGTMAKGAGDYNGDGYQDMFGTSNYYGYAGLVYGNAAGTFAFDGNNASVGVLFGSGTYGFGSLSNDLQVFGGSGATWIGDSNGDGLSDIAIANLATGVAYVKFGTATQVANQTLDFGTVFAPSGASFGISGIPTVASSETFSASVDTSLAPAGDVNGDGYADLLILAPGTSSAYVVYGKPNGSEVNVNLATMTASQGFKVSVTNTGWRFAVDGATVGDVNGDGYADLVIGEPYKIGVRTSLGEGAAVVIFGGATGAHGDIIADTTASSGGWATQLSFAGMSYPGWTGITPDVALGLEIGRSAGDVNGDGLSDFTLSGLPSTGRPLVIYGDTAMSSLASNPLLRGSNATGSAADERLLGTSGNDTLSGGGGADAISAGAGNDTVLIHDAGFLHLDGGLGVDTLKLDATASGVNLDFTANGMGGRVVGFEGIDLTGAGNNSLKITVQDVLHQSNVANTAATSFNEAHLMVISGNAGDTVTMANSISLNPGTWSAGSALSVADRTALSGQGYQFVAGDSYTVYTNGLATLIVDNAVHYQVM